MPRHPKPPPTPREAGEAFLETLWFAFANRIFERAIKIYKVDPDVAAELRTKMLKRGDFVIVAASQNTPVDDL